MNVKTEINGTSVTAFLSGEIDHHNAPQIREAIDECVAFRQPDRLILDFGDVGDRHGKRRLHGQLGDRACYGKIQAYRGQKLLVLYCQSVRARIQGYAACRA